MNRNHEFIKSISIDDIPWNRLVTAYGRATDFPSYLHALQGSDIPDIENAGEQIALDIEHQSTLWPATPFAMIFLVRIFEKAISDMKQDVNRYVVVNLLDLFIEVAESCNMANEMEHADSLPLFEDMLKEEYLWSEEYDEEEDEARYEEEEGPFPDDLFYSFYYYSDMVLRFYKNDLQKHSEFDDSEIAGKIKRLISLIN